MIGFQLNQNMREIVVTFSEVVNASSVVSQGFILQSKVDATYFPHERYPLKTAYTTSENGNVISIMFDESDLNSIFAITALGNTEEDTFLTITNASITDIAGNPAIPTPLTNAVQASLVVPDTNPPSLLSFALDMNIGLLSLTYSEVVLTSSIQFNQFTLQSGPNASLSATYTLSGGTTGDIESEVINITFSITDLFGIQAKPGLASDLATSYLSFTNLSAADAQNYAVNVIDSQVAEQAADFTPDTTDPELLFFNFDLNIGILELFFDEVIDGNNVDFSKIVLRSSEAENATTFPLDGSNAVIPGYNSLLTVDLGEGNLNFIKALIDLATSPSNTYLSLNTSVVQDTSGNAYSNTTAVYSVNLFGQDVQDPVLESFDLNVDSATLTLYFSEAVNVKSLDVRGITLQHSIDSVEFSVVLDMSFSSSDNLPTIDITLMPFDLNEIKSIPELATDQNNTYLSISAIAIQDMSGRSVVTIFPTDAKQVSMFFQDSTGPQVDKFLELDMNSGVMAISFNEFVNVTSLDLTYLRIVSDTVSSAQGYFLTNTATINMAQTDGENIYLMLSNSDLNEIKKLRELAISMDSTYLQVDSLAILDMIGNTVQAMSGTEVVPVEKFVPDETRPEMITFDTNIDGGTITIHFTETIDSITANITLITLQQEPGVGVVSHTLTDGTIAEDSADLMITLAQDDLNELTRLGICTDDEVCYLTFPNETFSDMVGNAVRGINSTEAERVDIYMEDMSSPILMNVSVFDLDAGLITLEFDETVSVASVNFSGLSLDQYSFADTSRYTLTGGDILGDDLEVITLAITTEDLNAIKKTPVCSSEFDAF